MKKIAVVTATRAEYGLLTPIIRRIIADKELELELIVTGAHLSGKQGQTIDDIKKDGFPIAYKINILEDDNTPFGISLTMSNAIREFAGCFRDDRPNMVVILGDRTEMLGVAAVAMNEQIPIAHIHGGEITEGAVDDCVRHAITKMSYLHFTSTEEYRRRVIQLGENPDRVFNVGGLGVENIRCTELMNNEEIHADIGIPLGRPYAVVTYHPETIHEKSTSSRDIASEISYNTHTICNAMKIHKDLFYVVTAANTDAGGDIINKQFEAFCQDSSRAIFIRNLGTRRYLSAVKSAEFVMGNSSSGILEAPVLGTPTINIGDRQNGRIMADTVVCCKMDYHSIISAINKARNTRHSKTDIFGDGLTSEKIIAIIKDYLLIRGIDLKKGFYSI